MFQGTVKFMSSRHALFIGNHTMKRSFSCITSRLMSAHKNADVLSKFEHLGQNVSIQDLLARNEAWSQKMSSIDPYFFSNLATKQLPKVLWIGCSDSRVPETTVMDLLPGEVFVMRNIANVVVNSDLSMLSCVQFAIEVLQVAHVIVCGHYGCGGVQAALSDKKLGIVDNWLTHVRDVRADHDEELNSILEPAARAARLVELNVLAQTRKVARISCVADAVALRKLQLHALVYDVANGKMKRLQSSIDDRSSCYMLKDSDLDYH